MRAVARCLEWILEAGLQGRRPGVTPPFAPEKVRRILVARKDNIGDVLCTTPALRALRRAFPEAHLAILVAEHCRAAVERNPTWTRSSPAPRPSIIPGSGGCGPSGSWARSSGVFAVEASTWPWVERLLRRLLLATLVPILHRAAGGDQDTGGYLFLVAEKTGP